MLSVVKAMSEKVVPIRVWISKETRVESSVVLVRGGRKLHDDVLDPADASEARLSRQSSLL